MDSYVPMLHPAMFAAALLQTATGVGFGIIAGPIILIVMNSGSASRISILLNPLIALVLALSLYGRADKPLPPRLMLWEPWRADLVFVHAGDIRGRGRGSERLIDH